VSTLHLYTNLVSSSSTNPHRRWQTVNKLLHRKSTSPLPTSSSSSVPLPDRFASFFTDRISKLHLCLSSHPTMASQHCPSSPASPPDISSFRPASESEVSKILFSCPNKQSEFNPIPTWLLKECSVLILTITNIVNLSLSSSQFHPILKQSVISLPF